MAATSIGLLIELCGLSQKEASVYLDVSHDTVRSWSSGRNTTPDRAIISMRELYQEIVALADKTQAQIDAVPKHIDTIRIRMPKSDADAKKRYRMPFISAFLKSVALICASSTRKIILTQDIAAAE